MDTRPIQKGNPAGLTRFQHVHAAFCLKKFADAAGNLSVKRLSTADVFQARPEDPIFCAERAWSQKAEEILMARNIEKKFFGQLKRICQGNGIQNHLAITEYFHLWSVRRAAKAYPMPATAINGIAAPEIPRSVLQRQHMEKKGYITIGDDGYVSGQDLAGVQLLIELDRRILRFGKTTWGVIKSREGDFILPDGMEPISDKRFLFPVTPDTLLVEGDRNGELSLEGVSAVNLHLLDQASKYIVAREFAACPGI